MPLVGGVRYGVVPAHAGMIPTRGTGSRATLPAPHTYGVGRPLSGGLLAGMDGLDAGSPVELGCESE